jgi:predicted extracellular nuclease
MRYATLLPLLLIRASAFAQVTPICALQGTGTSSPVANQVVTTTGIITAIHLGTGSLEGFFMEEPGCDTDPFSSNGIFVYDPTPGSIVVGDRVQVTGQVVEYQGLTELTNVQSATVIGTGQVPPTDITLPLSFTFSLEPLEGMLLHFPQTLVVNDVADWARYGQVTLAPQRLFAPTNEVDPNDAVASGTSSNGSSNVPAVVALDALNTRSTMILDDGGSSSYPDPPPMMGPEGTLRAGSMITGLNAVLSYGFNTYRLQPAGTVPIVHNTRPLVPVVGGQLRVASLNVLNYWTTLGGWGATNSAELARQRTKLVAALAAMDADILALHELENNTAAFTDLLGALNTVVGASYLAIDDGTVGAATKSVYFYRPSTVTPCTPLYTLNTSTFQRPHHTQGFQVNATGGRLLVSMLHLRSKNCGGGGISDQDQGDGQGCYNGTRKVQAYELLNHWGTVRGITGIDAQLAIGDMNAYTEEDPLDIMRAYAFSDLLATDAYSYLYGGTFGALDHALGTTQLVDALAGASTWAINSDEPEALGYADANLPLYQPGAFRCSDHDPVLVGLNSAQLPVSVAERPLEQDILFSRVDGLLTWTFTRPIPAGSDVELWSMEGRLVAHSTPQATDRMTIAVDGLAAGLYAWKLTGSALRKNGKVVLP